MTAPNVAHQSGQSRAFIDYDPMTRTSRMYVMIGESLVQFDANGDVVTRSIPEGMRPSEDAAFLAWHDALEDQLIDMFRAVGKALEIYSDEPGFAYKQGYAEGQASVLREWNESYRRTLQKELGRSE